jgi:ferric-dicitrate binding protein FerR (iron transport regulator)
LEDQNKLKRIYSNFLKNQCSETEISELLTYFDVADEFLLKDLIYAELLVPFEEGSPTPEEEIKLLQIFKAVKRINQQALPKIVPLYKRTSFLRLAAACLTLMILTVSLFIYLRSKQDLPSLSMEKDVDPGTNKAVLTLANGKQIALADGVNHSLAEQNGVKITTTAAGQLVYTFIGDQGKHSEMEQNQITTPRGGQYQLQLVDGTKIWLNAASSVKFPVSFQGSTRNVELQGEAYFEVAKDKAHPFIVKSIHQEVEVLGTHFNLKVYENGLRTRTTLLEGSVKVNQVILKPGEESTLTAGRIEVKNVDTDNAVSWKNGFFNFDNEPLEQIMNDIGRWYDLDVKFKDEELKKKMFSGSISKYVKVSHVLSKLSLTRSVRFEIQGNTIIVMK